MKPRRVMTAGLIAGGMLIGGFVQAGTPSASMLANTCFGCHGPGGNSNGPATPTLAGASAEYFEEVMEAYQSGDRRATIMDRIAKGYTKEEIKLLAGYFSKQKFVPAKGQKFDPKKAKKGAKLHDKYCEKCHADGGSSPEDDSGILAGQWRPYLKYTLDDILAGKSEMPKKMMKKLKKLHKKKGDAGIEALLNYYASKQ
ncbi:MAG: cytochrome c4 [Gammaproteobacteria bacterium]|nr:MAG: cytochrome c4 [Gammaproteobacteria bacterium]RTZ76222.1 MAG: cytochrome c4 [Gammaproteobacteria bacterium]RTZ79188.1 MAG: cytochrome c4 [Gammaproteobacteria bacterium]